VFYADLDAYKKQFMAKTAEIEYSEKEIMVLDEI
jgi:hypothetical protein